MFYINYYSIFLYSTVYGHYALLYLYILSEVIFAVFLLITSV